MTFFKEFISELSLSEKKYLDTIHTIRNKQSKRILSQYQSEFIDFQGYLQKNNLELSFQTIEDYKLYSNNDTINDMINHLPIFFVSQEKDILQNKTYNESLCKDYIESLLFTTTYYFKYCIHWKYCTHYHEGPLLKYLSNYLQLNKISFTTDYKPMTILQQLEYILPNQSHKIHSYKISHKPNTIYIPHLEFCRYLWECPIYFK